MKNFAVARAVALMVLVTSCAPAQQGSIELTDVVSAPDASVDAPSGSASRAPRESPRSSARPDAWTDEASEELRAELEGILGEADGYRIGVAVGNASTSTVLAFGDQSRFFAASTAKLLTAAAFYVLVEEGEVSLDEPLGSHTAGQQIELMVNRSDNQSWLLLMNRIGYAELSAFAAGFDIDYHPEENMLTAVEMARVLELIQPGGALSQQNSRQLLEYMQGTNNENLIPSALREDTRVHHKYGQLGGNLHDCAILSQGASTVELVIYTERVDVTTDQDQTETIHSVTRAVEEAFLPGSPLTKA